MPMMWQKQNATNRDVRLVVSFMGWMNDPHTACQKLCAHKGRGYHRPG